MKIKKIILVALMFGTLITNANEKDNTNYKDAKKTVKVEFNNVKKGQTLTIKNSNGLTVYNNEIQNSGDYSKTFDFSALENGIYSAELNKDFEIVIKQFYVENGLVTFLNNKDEKIFKPIIRTEGDLLLVSKINFNNEPLKVTLYYNDEVVLSETISGDRLLKRVYKLSEKEVGAYKVVVSSDERTYSKEFNI
ncbi:hypothetical protein BTO15_03625 [Polaribacter sejongensis]|uniref:Secretion system C-terminal sorting domain-containing protein n=1 Tax=Polaribacter sejongensis TaxID=985043 RepID=A0ABM6PXA0_9FLAO|nr:hypothetical protein [Polaribacter sejongensis]AUC21250.1 hypothetical protein BTO15_03625 [Polaribacter sejongensis]